MDNLARALNSEQVFLEYGRVTGSEGRFFTVETGSAKVKTTKSVSCLVEPVRGDTVLISIAPSGTCYILGILERENVGHCSLIFDGDVEFKAKEGRLRVAAQEGIDLVSAKDTALVSPELSINSVQAEVSIQHLSFFGTFLQGQIQKIKLIGQTCDSIFERVSQRVKRCYRWVDELDQLKAGQLNYLVKKLMSLRGKYSVLTAEEDVRIDGDKILMG
ncbi:MAG: DUF3540 domain-containing protein [Deltaproteobacteria bacterium]|nr:MAG: DUF3540 domain-containing protein [Deltaproteobacteria bacterium]